MKPAFIIFCAMVVVGIVLYIIDRLQRRPGEEPEPIVEPDTSCTDDCCGTNEVCPSEKLLENMNKPVEYYDDQELDDYRGRLADDYTDTEIEQWRDVLYTLQPADLMGWERSVKKRGIIMPATIHDEFIMLAGEARTSHQAKQQKS